MSARKRANVRRRLPSDSGAPPRARRRQSSRRRRVLLRLAGAALIVSLALLAGAAWWASRPGPGPGKVVALSWPEQAGAGQAAELLVGAGLARSPRLLALYFWAVQTRLQFQPGLHLLNDALSPRQLAQRLARVPTRPAVKVTIPEGYNYLQVAERLERAQVCTRAGFQRAATDKALLAELGIGAPSLEGYLFPATYDLLVNSTPDAVARQLVRELRRRLDKLRARYPRGAERLQQEHGWDWHQILILASIVEREAGNRAEQKTIAGVFFNRLRHPDFRPKGTLQSDPTAGYGCLIAPSSAPSCLHFSGRVTPAMLRDPLNPYNTYRHPGLPPGPIANPGESAIEAVLEPAATDYLFFFASGERRHTFSRSFEEHRAAVRASSTKSAPNAEP